MKHQVELEAPVFLYLEGIYKELEPDESMAGFDFDTGSFEDFVSRYVNAYLFESEDFRQKSEAYVRRHWDALVAERPQLLRNMALISLRDGPHTASSGAGEGG